MITLLMRFTGPRLIGITGWMLVTERVRSFSPMLKNVLADQVTYWIL